MHPVVRNLRQKLTQKVGPLKNRRGLLARGPTVQLKHRLPDVFTMPDRAPDALHLDAICMREARRSRGTDQVHSRERIASDAEGDAGSLIGRQLGLAVLAMAGYLL